MLVSWGSLFCTLCPLGRTPLPQSWSKGSVRCCEPYLLTLNPQANGCFVGLSLLIQPSIGRVITVSAPTPVLASMNASAWGVKRTFSKK